MSWFLYLIECADDSVYTGITTDVAARFDEHAAGKGARYTRSRKPRAVLASFPLPDRSSASRVEYWVKRLTAAQKRELAAGLRTLESVLPAGVTIDGSGDLAGLKAGTRGRKKVKAKTENVDSATKTAETEKAAGKVGKTEKAGKAGKAIKAANTAKPRQAAKAPKAAKAAPVAKRAKTGGDAVVNKTSSRGTPATKDQQAASPSSKRKTSPVGSKPVTNGRDALAPAPARRRPSAATSTKATEATEISVAPRRARRAKDTPDTTTQPAPAAPSARRKTARAKQNRAAS
ncbi:GIY-YIG nuclease family protein [Burkholderia pyrrocinia]|uniref:GIY-YIG nuclease family protein n=1 Tax=Burkholderia pyrrocinia TaxID=60550 RepID=UPI0015777774|nr:GIY-YIG nuclease family protein [Burkholderia pyrrocinia]NTX30804.1 GIY-YIG nuclease family protein [Burkholderia pyrrocinia]